MLWDTMPYHCAVIVSAVLEVCAVSLFIWFHAENGTAVRTLKVTIQHLKWYIYPEYHPPNFNLELKLHETCRQTSYFVVTRNPKRFPPRQSIYSISLILSRDLQTDPRRLCASEDSTQMNELEWICSICGGETWRREKKVHTVLPQDSKHVWTVTMWLNWIASNGLQVSPRI